VNGWDAKRIPAKLFSSALTVRKYIANIYEKRHTGQKQNLLIWLTKIIGWNETSR